MEPFTDEEVTLLKRLVEEFEWWPGTGETPCGITLSEKEDYVLWDIINKIKAA